MLVHGGFNEEYKCTYDDISAYDIDTRKWITFTQLGNKKISIGKLSMHTMTTVVSTKIDQKV